MSIAEKIDPRKELVEQLERRSEQFANALPSHIKPAHFQRATLTAIAQNPKLLSVDRQSLFNSLMRCAQDGLIPDGRQAALVIFNSRTGPIAQYMPMVAGVRKLVQQSGEITRFEQVVVYHGDEFTYELGDQPFIRHKPALADRGTPMLVYSVAQYRDGTLSRDIMTVDDIEKVRAVSRAKDDGPWVEWWDEMAKKTIAKRHAKVLPMSNDAAEALARDDEFKPLSALPPRSIERRPRLAERLESLGPAHQPPEETQPARKRGRPRKEPETDDDAVDQVPDGVGEPLPLEGDPLTPPSPDFMAGVADARRGAAACLNGEIRDDPKRFSQWRAGFEAERRKP